MADVVGELSISIKAMVMLSAFSARITSVFFYWDKKAKKVVDSRDDEDQSFKQYERSS
jgi:hypothetical protein